LIFFIKYFFITSHVVLFVLPLMIIQLTKISRNCALAR